MKSHILSRYILREHIGPFFFGFSVITLIFLLNLLFRELSRILSKGLPWHVVLEFFALNMAWIVALAVPMAVLIATLMAFGRFSADNEVTAMKASGISLYRIISPVLVAAAVVAAGMIWFNNAVLPDFNHRARLLAGDIARKTPGVSIEPGVWYDRIPNFGLLVQELEDSVRTGGAHASNAGITIAHNLLIDDHSDPDRSRTLSARRGYIELNPRLGALVLTLFDGEMQEIDIRKPEEFRRIMFSKHLLSIAVDDMFLRRSESEYRGDREKSAQQMRREVNTYRAQIAENLKTLHQSIARDLYRTFGTSFGLAGKTMDSLLAQMPGSILPNERFARAVPAVPLPDFPAARKTGSGTVPLVEKSQAGDNESAEALAQQRQERLSNLLRRQREVLYNVESQIGIIRSLQRSTKSLLVEIHKKYSIPVACLVFVVIGAPLGFMARRGGLATGGGLSLGFFLLYWTFLIGGEDLADRQIISPFLAMWSANFLVGAAGLYLLWRTARETITVDFTKLWRLWKK
ncbi:MAG: LptF/LptG family permease [candidate division KSB1 bacterium]|nr:LptF/LptG family permease [candidate division KSB1 bacterium]MDZ7303919.1 LptF/LptG family permease [candidate division KSB1 bacterium]MDZ7313080.1 LptF/LptG family permease [candidate division KSB1 bacterium]